MSCFVLGLAGGILLSSFYFIRGSLVAGISKDSVMSLVAIVSESCIVNLGSISHHRSALSQRICSAIVRALAVHPDF